MFGQKFEQTQSIVSRLRQILEEYPFGNTLLLELLQNADDAAASDVAVLFDERVIVGDHPVANSPALLFRNSAEFSERDLDNISKLVEARKAQKSAMRQKSADLVSASTALITCQTSGGVRHGILSLDGLQWNSLSASTAH